jgi:hypothetical protein
MGGAYRTHDRGEKYIKLLGRKTEGKRPLGRSEGGWEYNIKTSGGWMTVKWVGC